MGHESEAIACCRRVRNWLLGTDRMGADIYSRMLFGARITLVIAIVAVGASLLIGVPIGLWPAGAATGSARR